MAARQARQLRRRRGWAEGLAPAGVRRRGRRSPPRSRWPRRSIGRGGGSSRTRLLELLRRRHPRRTAAPKHVMFGHRSDSHRHCSSGRGGWRTPRCGSTAPSTASVRRTRGRTLLRVACPHAHGPPGEPSNASPKARRVLDRPRMRRRSLVSNAMIAMLAGRSPQCGTPHRGGRTRWEAHSTSPSTVGPRDLPSATGPLTVAMFISHLFDGQMRDFDPVLAVVPTTRRCSARRIPIAASGRSARPVRTVARGGLGPTRFRCCAKGGRAAAPPRSGDDPAVVASPRSVQALGASDDARGASAAFDELEAVRFRGHPAHRGRDRAGTPRGTAGGPRGKPLRIAGDRRSAVRRARCTLTAAPRWPRWRYHDALRLGAPRRRRRGGPLEELCGHRRGPRRRHDGPKPRRPRLARPRSSRARGRPPDAFEGGRDDAACGRGDGRRQSPSRPKAGASRLSPATCGVRAAGAGGGPAGPALTPASSNQFPSRDAPRHPHPPREQEVALMAARGMTKRGQSPSRCRCRCARSATTSTTSLRQARRSSSREELRVVLHL